MLLAGFAAVFVTVFPPHLLVNDSFLTLAAGREVVEHGLPSRDELTTLGAGRTWTDQQWGAQILAYGAHRYGGYALLALVASICSLGAFLIAATAARKLGAGPRAFVVVFFPVLFAATWAWTIRAQVFALPLYTGLIWLLAAQARRPSPRVFLAIPLLVVWANVHGSVALGAVLTMLFAAIELVVRRPRQYARDAVLLLLAPLAVLATPYGPVDTFRYYRLMLVDSPLGDQVGEWQPSYLGWNTLAFYLLAAGALVLVIWGRRRLTMFDIAVLAVTFVGGVQALRGIQWFALACLILLPVAIGTRLDGRPAPIRRGLNRSLAVGAVAAVLAVVSVSFLRDSAWYQSGWPNEALPAVREAAARPGARVFATDLHADWLLWKVPELRGRIAYDVRFEIYPSTLFDGLDAFYREAGDWKRIAAGYDVVVIDEDRQLSPTDDFLEEPGAQALYRDELIAVVQRPARP